MCGIEWADCHDAFALEWLSIDISGHALLAYA